MPKLVDIFNDDAFGAVTLTTRIQKVPPAPTTIGALGIFRSVPIQTTVAAVEERHGRLALIPTTHRGGPGVAGSDEKREMRHFKVPHIQVDDTVQADDALNVRAFGSADSLETASEIIDRKLAIMANSVDTTREYLRMGALLGQITYPTGSVDSNVDLYNEFDVTDVNIDMLTGTSSTDVLNGRIPAVRDAMEDQLGGTPYTGIYALCGRDFFRALVAHESVLTQHHLTRPQWETPMIGMPRPNRMAVQLGGITFEEYYGVVSDETFIPADQAIAFPLGVDVFHSYLAPADLPEAVGTLGQPIYARQYASVDGKSIHVEVQSNPLEICVRPGCLIRLHQDEQGT